MISPLAAAIVFLLAIAIFACGEYAGMMAERRRWQSRRGGFIR